MAQDSQTPNTSPSSDVQSQQKVQQETASPSQQQSHNPQSQQQQDGQHKLDLKLQEQAFDSICKEQLRKIKQQERKIEELNLIIKKNEIRIEQLKEKKIAKAREIKHFKAREKRRLKNQQRLCQENKNKINNNDNNNNTPLDRVNYLGQQQRQQPQIIQTAQQQPQIIQMQFQTGPLSVWQIPHPGPPVGYINSQYHPHFQQQQQQQQQKQKQRQRPVCCL
ncbi:unnamed protein product [Ambrosiozyma monospora]|uniref:Unnamed protein product n=1 Tax=Ambrosiozyma monospora TaxID=43982 RepID=A0ACB5T041_AMBMO|nr:unnamed protein product [Ambrosiozyma monospora]